MEDDMDEEMDDMDLWQEVYGDTVSKHQESSIVVDDVAKRLDFASQPTTSDMIDHESLYDLDQDIKELSGENNSGLHDDYSEFTVISDEEPLEQEEPEEEEPEAVYIFQRPPVMGDYISITNSSGKRGYVTLETYEESISRVKRKARASSRAALKQFTVFSITDMLEEIEKDNLREAHFQALEAKKNKELLLLSDEKNKGIKRNKDYLWVDKYTPKCYSDLLSKEKTNRNILSWIKSWEACVFPNKIKNESTKMNNNNNKNINRSINYDDNNENKDVRPDIKVILLAGSPGLGKTTVAHILATHAGYRPVEINASDDRSAEKLNDRVRAATEMASVFTDSRPNCIILDEIDGAVGGAEEKSAIETLLKIIKAGGELNQNNNKNNDNNNDNKSNKNKKKKKLPILKRPIICICNDQYAPALAPLRREANVFVFDKPDRERLIHRLAYICRKEKISYENHALGILCDLLHNDIRSCINSLQFLSKKNKSLNSSTLQDAYVGQKDIIKDQFQLWNMIFSPPIKIKKNKLLQMATQARDVDGEVLAKKPNHQNNQNRRKKRNNNNQNNISTNKKQEMQTWFDIDMHMMDHSQLNRVIEGLYHNYIHQITSDTNFEKTVSAADWLCICDNFGNNMQQYIPYSVIGLRLCTLSAANVNRKPKLTLPRMFYEVYKLKISKINIAQSFLSSSNNTFGLQGTTIRTLILEVISPLLDILSPSIRSVVNLQMLNSNEKLILNNIINTFIDLNITFSPVQTELESNRMNKNNYNNYNHHQQLEQQYALEPRIHFLTKFHELDEVFQKSQTQAKLGVGSYLSSIKNSNIHYPHEETTRHVLTNSIKKLLSYEIRIGQIRKQEKIQDELSSILNERKRDVGNIFSTDKPQLKDKNGPQKRKTVESDRKDNENKDNKIPKLTRTTSTFLDDHNQTLRQNELDNRTFYCMHYKFHEGFTTAVRRPVPLDHFIE